MTKQKLSSYEGMHYMIGFMENESRIAEPGKQLDQKIFISSNHDATLQVKMGTLFPVQHKVRKDEILTLNIPFEYESFISEEIKRNLVEITSDYPISISAFSSIPRSTDSYAVIPITNWGKEYVAVSLPNDQYNLKTLDSIKDKTPRTSQVLIMAAYNNTKVTITPASQTGRKNPANTAFDVILDKGESYLVKSWSYPRGMGDMTGTIIKSDKPVGVLSGHVRTALLQGFVAQPPDSKDHLLEMLMPLSAWGKEYVSIPFGTNPNNGDYFKIVTAENNVSITLESAGISHEYQLGNKRSLVVEGIKEPALWKANAPFQLAQFMYRTGDTAESFFYDPSMLVIPPREQFVNKIIFNTPYNNFAGTVGMKFIEHYVSIIAELEALGTLRLDGKLLLSSTDIENQQIGETGLYHAKVLVESGKHELISETGRFAGILYGVGNFDSYAMTLGCSLLNPSIEDNIPPYASVFEECGKLTGTISDVINDSSFGIYYASVQTDITENYNWNIAPFEPDDENISFTAEPIDKFKDGRFVLDYYDKSGNRERYEFVYNAILLEYPEEIILPPMDYKDSVCFDFTIKNNSKNAMDFLSSEFTVDSRVKLYLDITPPAVLASGQEIKAKLCLDPDGNSSPFYGKVTMDFGCDVTLEIPYNGVLMALDLQSKGVDFGSVQLGKVNCSAVSIVNNGNFDVLLNELEFTDEFELDTLGLFPYILGSQQELFIPVCFSPDERRDYSDAISFINEYNLSIKANVSGTGIAPLVESNILDFGKLRIGSSKTLPCEINNTGNQIAILSFNGFSQKTHSDDGTSALLQTFDNLQIEVNTAVEEDITHIPLDTNKYIIEASYKTNWEQHPDISITVTGQGTIPVIEAHNHNFGNIEIHTEKEENVKLISSSGNEDLTVDEVFIADGDKDAFEIDTDLMKNIIIPINNSTSTAIKFKPKRIGYHELTLGVIHDAKPNFMRDTVYLLLVGNALPPDNYNIEINTLVGQINSCVYETAEILIKNNAFDAELTGLRLEKSNDDFEAEILDFNPMMINSGESAIFKVRIYAERGIIGKVKVIATFFDRDEIESEFDVVPVSGLVILDDISPTRYAVGDYVDLKLSGSFESGIDTLGGFFLSIGVDYTHLSLVSEKIELNLDILGENLKYNLNISKTKDKLEFFLSEDLINIIENVIWSVELRFLGLLSEKIKGDWKISAASDKCFEPAEKIWSTELDSVCNYDARHIFISAERAHANIYPNPVVDNLRIKTIYPEQVNNVRVSIMNSLGTKYMLTDDANIRAGEDLLEFDVSRFPSGTYFLIFETETLKKNILFIIIR
ncbi:MAG: T9SS type A sorting domain-containing protein [Candidatus Kapaibacterium sp.]